MEKLPAQMTVIGISKPGGPEVLVPETRAVPVPAQGEILIKVAAAGVNRPDVAQRSGVYPPPPGASDLPGLEISGVVVAVGPGATALTVILRPRISFDRIAVMVSTAALVAA